MIDCQFLETVKNFPSNSTAGYLASLEQVDKEYIHATQEVKPKEETALDRRYQELLEQVRLLDIEAFQLKKEVLFLSCRKPIQLKIAKAWISKENCYKLFRRCKIGLV